MSTIQILAGALVLHLLLAGAALLAIRRVEGCTRAQVKRQSLVALFVPWLGPIVVLFMARDEIAGPPKPDDSSFDRQPYGND